MPVDYLRRGAVVIIQMNRPKKLNAITVEMRRSLAEASLRFENDPEAQVAVLTGAGRAFCAGVDVKESASNGVMAMREPQIDIPCLFWTNNDLTKPVIAAVQGYSMGVGAIMSLLTADLCIAAESAVFEISEIPRGIMEGWQWGYQQRLSRQAAMELAFGYRISGRRAYDMGLVAEVVPDAQLLDAAIERANHLGRIAPAIIRAHRDLVRKLVPAIPPDVQELAAAYSQNHRGSDDALEAVRSWMEGRPPVFAGWGRADPDTSEACTG